MSIFVEVERAIGRPRLWDLALDHGPKCIDSLRNLVRVITFPPLCLHAPCARRRTFQETLSFLTFLPLTQEVPVIATNSYHYFYQSLTLTQFCLITCVLWLICSQSSCIVTLYPVCPLGLCNEPLNLYSIWSVCVCVSVCVSVTQAHDW